MRDSLTNTVVVVANEKTYFPYCEDLVSLFSKKNKISMKRSSPFKPYLDTIDFAHIVTTIAFTERVENRKKRNSSH
jgi:hypothetical protein